MVYVDSLKNFGWEYGASCHLIADTEAELKDFAVKKLGLKVQWFQAKSSPHFDLTATKRKLAVKCGAIELNNKDFVNKLRELREKINDNLF